MKSMEALLNKSSKLRDIHGKVEADSRQGEIDTTGLNVFCFLRVFVQTHHPTSLATSVMTQLKTTFEAMDNHYDALATSFGEIPCKWQAGRYVTLINQKVQPYKWNHWFPWPINTFNKRWLQWCICSVVFLWPTPRLLKNIKKPARICWSVVTWIQIWSWPNSLKNKTTDRYLYSVGWFLCVFTLSVPQGRQSYTSWSHSPALAPETREMNLKVQVDLYLEFKIKTPERPTTYCYIISWGRSSGLNGLKRKAEAEEAEGELPRERAPKAKAKGKAKAKSRAAKW